MSDGYHEGTWDFEAGGWEWEVLDADSEWVGFKETRCNGQEDDHVQGEVVLKDGRWAMEDSAHGALEHYKDGKTQLARDIEAFFDEHGSPS